MVLKVQKSEIFGLLIFFIHESYIVIVMVGVTFPKKLLQLPTILPVLQFVLSIIRLLQYSFDLSIWF